MKQPWMIQAYRVAIDALPGGFLAGLSAWAAGATVKAACVIGVGLTAKTLGSRMTPTPTQENNAPKNG